MLRSHLMVLVALIVVLVIGGIGAFALSRPQAPVAMLPTVAVVQARSSNTPTETKISATVSATMTVSPTFRFVKTLYPTSVPNATNVIIQVSPNATFIPLNTLLPIVTRTGPTLTPSGPLVELTEAAMQKLKTRFPKQLGGIEFEIDKNTNVGQLVAGHANDDLSQFLLVRISISDSVHTSDTFFTSTTAVGELSNYERLKIGDEAIITLDRRNLLGLMRWRNCIIKLVVESSTGYFEPRLTGDQVVQIFEDIVTFLDQNNQISTPTPYPTAQNIVIPADSTFVPMPTQVLIQTLPGPTITPSGPLIELGRQSMRHLQKNFPKQLGGLDFVVTEDLWDDVLLDATHQYQTGQHLNLRISFGESPQSAEAGFRAVTLQANFKNPYSIKVGDEAIINVQNIGVVAIMRFRNAVVLVELSPFNGLTDPPLSEETLTQILEDIEQFLDKEALYALSSPTQVATIARTSTLNPTPHTPTTQPLGGSLEEVRRILANAPKTVGGLPLTTNPKTTDDLTPVISILNTDGTRYYITLSFGNSGKDFEQRIGRIKQFAVSFRTIDLADETLLFEGSRVLILMRYRNVLIPLERPDPQPSAAGPTPVPLTEAQLIAIMTDLYTYLSQQ